MSKRRIIDRLAPIAGLVSLSLAGSAFANGPGYPAYSAPAAAYGSSANTFRVDLDHTGVLRLPSPASAVVVGNPDVADVAVHSTDTLLVLGRSYGTTNVLAMDSVGRVIGDYSVTVGAHGGSARVRIYEGTERQTYNCSPNCNPAPELGDNSDFMTTFRPAAPAINNTIASPGLSAGVVPQPVTSSGPPPPEFDYGVATSVPGPSYGPGGPGGPGIFGPGSGGPNY